MKKYLYASALLCLWTAAVYGQSPALGVPSAPAAPAATPPARALKGSDSYAGMVESPKLTRFNLNFPGGNPQQLVAAIEKATGRPLNVVIPDEYANESLSALRMTQVTVPDLFRAMEQASYKTIPYRTSSYGPGQFSYQQLNTSISFQTSGAVSDDSIWYFRGRQQPPDLSAWEPKIAPVKINRFYALTPYLDQGLKVEDITTAIQTGWKMLGEKETPSISFHKETKLLIAVGEPGKLETIDAVLNALRPVPPTFVPPTFAERVKALTAPPVAPPKTPGPALKPAPVLESEP